MNELDQLELIDTVCDEHLIICQCSLFAIDASNKYNNAIAIEQYATFKDDKQLVIEGFKEKIHNVYERLKEILNRILETFHKYYDKITNYIKEIVLKLAMRVKKLDAYSLELEEKWYMSSGITIKTKLGTAEFLQANQHRTQDNDLKSIEDNKNAIIKSFNNIEAIEREIDRLKTAKGLKWNGSFTYSTVEELFPSYETAFDIASGKLLKTNTLDSIVKSIDRAGDTCRRSLENQSQNETPEYLQMRVKLFNVALKNIRAYYTESVSYRFSAAIVAIKAITLVKNAK